MPIAKNIVEIETLAEKCQLTDMLAVLTCYQMIQDKDEDKLGSSPAFLENDLELVQNIFLNRNIGSKQNLTLNVADVKKVLNLAGGQSESFFKK